jgi:hypothetical protein
MTHADFVDYVEGANRTALPTCAMSPWDPTGAKDCPVNNFLTRLGEQKATLAEPLPWYPSVEPMLNTSAVYSFIGDVGLAAHASNMVLYGHQSFTLSGSIYNGFTTMTRTEQVEHAVTMARWLLEKNGRTPPFTADELSAAEVILKAISKHLSLDFIDPFADQRLQLAFEEFKTSSQLVACNPWGRLCAWSWGWVAGDNDHLIALDDNDLLGDLVNGGMLNRATIVDLNAVSLFLPQHSTMHYNVHNYCTKYYYPQVTPPLDVCDVEPTLDQNQDFFTNLPSGLWANDKIANDFSKNGDPGSALLSDRSDVIAAYKAALAAEAPATNTSVFYEDFSCKISRLMMDVFYNTNGFHEDYVVRFLNNQMKDPTAEFYYNHTFRTGAMSELGYAQWGAGAVIGPTTDGAITSISQLFRKGMFHIGPKGFYDNSMEYSSWAKKLGYPNAASLTFEESTILLDLMARGDADAISFRRHMSYRATTFIGDGEYYVNAFGDKGEQTFSLELVRSDFRCDSDLLFRKECTIIDVRYLSSGANCDALDELYDKCTAAMATNALLTNCPKFQVEVNGGIPCNNLQLYGNDHPVQAKVGNLLYAMMFELTISLVIKRSLWCDHSETYNENACTLFSGGLWLRTTPEKVLFQGITDPTFLKYFNLKHAADGISFHCSNRQQDQCGTEIFKCDESGLVVEMPPDSSAPPLILDYNRSAHDTFFVPELIYSREARAFVWPYSLNQTERDIANKFRRGPWSLANDTHFIRILNPHWAAYPAFDSGNVDFQKFLQCQGRLYSGKPHLFESCVNMARTGRDEPLDVSTIIMYRGNKTQRTIPGNDGETADTISGVPVKGRVTQHPFFAWQGFNSYPYYLNGASEGTDFDTVQRVTDFDKTLGIPFDYGQADLFFIWEKNVMMDLPVPDSFEPVSKELLSQETDVEPLSVDLRHFVEDQQTWEQVKTTSPRDSYGMPYIVPVDMVSVEHLTDLPLFIGTAHNWGNQDWVGLEHTHVVGLSASRRQHRSYLDYDPITGHTFRKAFRKQVLLRVEKDPLLANLFSSQGRCVSPTKTFSGQTGFGCFGYIPLFWFEEAEIIEYETVRSLNANFYLQPSRAWTTTRYGLIFGLVVLALGVVLLAMDNVRRSKFKARVYVD